MNFLSEDGSTLPEWEYIMDGVNPAPLYVQKRGGTLESVRKFIYQQAAPSLALLYERAPDKESFIALLVGMGEEAWARNAKYQSMLDEDN